MNSLDDIYGRLATLRTQQDLADGCRAVLRQGGISAAGAAPELDRPISVLAAAIPPSAAVSTAIQTLHALPGDVGGGLPEQLLDIAHRNVAHALRLCHHALELDGADHDYGLEEWLPIVYDIAGSLLASARLDEEPPTIVRATEEAISWLSRAIAELDRGSQEAAASLVETLARLLVVWIFTEAALRHGQSD